MNKKWLIQIVDKCLAPFDLILRKRSSWESLTSELERRISEENYLRSSMSPDWHAQQLRQFWNSRSKNSELGFISTLEPGAMWDLDEFDLVGSRFVSRMIERLNQFGAQRLSDSTVLEIGCGVGRFLKPLAGYFKNVVGVDISEEMLKVARRYCAHFKNVSFLLNDGKSLSNIKDESVEYCVSAGVFQHITDLRIIVNYIRESMRVLKPEGVFLFQFEGSRTEPVGSAEVGAQITARKLDEGLKEVPFQICEISQDSEDPIRNIVVVMRKTLDQVSLVDEERSFQKCPMIERPWLSGVYDGIKTKAEMHKRLAGQKQELTFYH